MAKLNVGDLVNLRSGGPCMTIVAVEGQLYRCNWFSMTSTDELGGQVYHGSFPRESLEIWVSDPVEEDDEVTVKKFGDT